MLIDVSIISYNDLCGHLTRFFVVQFSTEIANPPPTSLSHYLYKGSSSITDSSCLYKMLYLAADVYVYRFIKDVKQRDIFLDSLQMYSQYIKFQWL